MTEYEYIYTGTQLTQMIVTTTVDDETPTTETLYFTYETSGPMTVTYNGETYYYAANLQGDVVAILDDSGDAVVEYTYDAWGKLLTTSGELATTLGETNPLTYRGYVYDSETRFYYLQSRYYDPELGRFINADAYASTGQGILGNNMFAYCLNNPVVFVDSSGTAAHIGFSADGQIHDAPWRIGSPGGGGWSQDIHYSQQDYGSVVEKFYTVRALQFVGKQIAHTSKILLDAYMEGFYMQQEAQHVEAELLAPIAPRVSIAGVIAGSKSVLITLGEYAALKKIEPNTQEPTGAGLSVTFVFGYVGGAIKEIWNIIKEAFNSQ